MMTEAFQTLDFTEINFSVRTEVEVRQRKTGFKWLLLVVLK